MSIVEVIAISIIVDNDNSTIQNLLKNRDLNSVHIKDKLNAQALSTLSDDKKDELFNTIHFLLAYNKK